MQMPLRLALFLAPGSPAIAQSLVANLVTTTSGQFSSNVTRFVPFGARAAFAASGPFEREPWVTDGTVPGTFLLVDLRPAGDSQPDDFVALGSEVLFVATVPGFGRELWITGAFAAPFPIPADPSFLGLEVFFQWGVFDPLGQIFGGFAASDGLQVRIGP